MTASSERYLNLNGVDGGTGAYFNSPIEWHAMVEHMARVSSERGNTHWYAELRQAVASRQEVHFGISASFDPRDLAARGWGVVFPALRPGSEEHARQSAILEALHPLLEHRQTQAGQRFRILAGFDGYRPNEGKQKFLARHGVGPGPADPDRFPYYLLLVGSPVDLPYTLQQQLDLQYAVGRLHFETVDEYAAYATSVVHHEVAGSVTEPGTTVFFAPRHDDTTALAVEHLVAPLYASLSSTRSPMSVRMLTGDEATKQALSRVLNDPSPPSLLFFAGHGVVWPSDDPRQVSDQGALLCQDWPGPHDWRGPLPPHFYFDANDFPADMRLDGMIAFLYATCSGGTRGFDKTLQDRPLKSPHSPVPTVSALPQAMLARGALAVAGMLDIRVGCSLAPTTDPYGRHDATSSVFERVLMQLLFEGAPIGAAFDHINMYHAELSVDLANALEEVEYGRTLDDRLLVGQWVDTEDMRNLVLLGDPAVRLRRLAW